MEESTGETEITVEQEYKDLSDPDKVRVVLGAVLEPVTKEKAIELSGIDYDGLDEEERKEVGGVFKEEDIEKSEVANQERYRLSNDARSKIEKEINMKSVHSAIADILLKKAGIRL